MKNKSAVLSVLGALFMLGTVLHAAPGVRGAKRIVNVGQSTNSIGISSSSVVLYSVSVGTGAVTDFVTLFDSNSVVGLTSAQLSGNFRMRVYPSSATQNTLIVFDPPLQFYNGLIAIPATSLGNYLFAVENGRVIQGY